MSGRVLNTPLLLEEFSCEFFFCEVFQNSFFTEHLRATDFRSGHSQMYNKIDALKTFAKFKSCRPNNTFFTMLLLATVSVGFRSVKFCTVTHSVNEKKYHSFSTFIKFFGKLTFLTPDTNTYVLYE